MALDGKLAIEDTGIDSVWRDIVHIGFSYTDPSSD